MKVIFLDIDGVLNSRRYDLTRGGDDGNIDKTRLPLLKEIVDKTGAKIVLSTTWRTNWDKDESKLTEKGKELRSTLLEYGLEIYDKTPDIDLNERPKEIMAWLEKNEVDGFVIIDDTFGGWGELEKRLIKTSYYSGRGLEESHVQGAIELLK
ncbi:MAG: hypothetical protein J6B34_02995 [Clostridia bacterium]|nr:hypothetical protein [Clostridia bacterium]